MSRVKVYSTAGCTDCRATYRVLDSKGIGYEAIDIATLADVDADQLRAQGFKRLPVVVIECGDSWTGFRPDKLASLHLDVSQHYNGQNFVTMCACGKEFEGIDPDDADYEAAQHIEAEAGR